MKKDHLKSAKNGILVSIILLGGCTESFIESSVPPVPAQKTLSVQQNQFSHEVRFAEKDTKFTLDERRRLIEFLTKADARTADSVIVLGSAQSEKARQRLEIVRAHLLHQRLNPQQTLSVFAASNVEKNTVRVLVRRHLVTLPGCPDWTKKTYNNFGNTVHSNYGCATASNLGMMVAEPRDLIRGRTPGLVDGEYGARAIQAYRAGETKPLLNDGASETNVQGSSTGSSSSSSSSATGAGS